VRAGRGPDRLTGPRVAHTADLTAAERGELRAFLDRAFDGDLTADDWEHCLGGLHAVVREGGDVVAHAALVQRRLLHGGRALRCGYVEGVAVRADRRRRGLGGAVMAPLERAAAAVYDVAALAATDEALPFYAARGWRLWRGPTSALTPAGLVRTPDADDCVHVRGDGLDLDGPLACDWREGDPW
jgi:aminoglycoside 2'-N-acetyltransferase I